ncbi:MAG TPA: DUF3800 domain-containing protein [Candidatus Acidoferrales bacterium]|nr:DUF3800 domain-containing protein [Candidatus Acidoferrales bacterium]
MLVEVTHVAYSDETHHNVGQFKGIGVLTTAIDQAIAASAEASTILAAAGVTELKWEKIRTAKDRQAAIRIVEWLFGKLDCLRVDVLTWDIEDPRHKVDRRDDVANLHRMFHHLMNNVLRRYPSGCTWRLHPDEQDSFDWERTHDFLDGAATKSGFYQNADRLTFRLRFEKDFRVIQIVPSRSHTEPLIQVADIFAGMAAFSRTHIATFRRWEKQQSGQTHLFETEEHTFSRGEREKCAVLSDFRHRCRNCALPVSLNSTDGLQTRDPRVALNFWHYEPQRQTDKAPTRPPRLKM